MTIKRFEQSQKFRVVFGQACFYTTALQIRQGIGDYPQFNAATQKALDVLETIRSSNDVSRQRTTYIGGTWENLQVQLNVA